MFFSLLKHVLLGPLLRIVFRPKVTGTVPGGAAILAANHLSFCDSLFLPLMAPRKVVFIGKEEYFVGTGLKGRLMAAFFRAVGTIPVDRSGGSEAADALDTALRVLGQGRLFGIYPEGTRSPDGRLYRGKTGVARLALASGAPVVPCALIGTDQVQPTGHRLPKKIMRVEVRFGEPLRFAEDADPRAVTDEIVAAIQKLSGQEYVDVYAASVKNR
ncbi:1-acyl-sn-glycerol-3-phosphate acyltransferase [Actinoallomurus purpureus]|uniref:lysophospholipid acyltransferase family protein n=1 Tax=Actinoallomurus purpureus TaxID=478114 RepID=UPI002092B016|nr:lysophospholipid acyltransferase family protein [Actinoallomurus purpureus]MCO6003749.1 1-acyl-sn-glycerol-3-phosphate acyltransferase [Actinoallomurus purpureus]